MTRSRANLVALLAAVAWGLGNVSQKTILHHLDGFSATGLTSIVGAVFLWPFLQHERRQNLPPAKGSFDLILKISLLFTFAATAMQFGYGHTTVTNAGFLVNTSAAITPIIGWLCFAHRPPPWIWLACGCTLIGVFLMAGSSVTGLSLGDGLALIAALMFAFWTVLLGQYVTRYRRPIQVTVVQLLICGGVCTWIGAATYGLPSFAAITAALPELIIIGAISKGLAYVLNATAQQHIAPACAAVIMSAESVFGSLSAMLILGETLSVSRAVGAAFILFGVIIATAMPTAVAVRDRP